MLFFYFTFCKKTRQFAQKVKKNIKKGIFLTIETASRTHRDIFFFQNVSHLSSKLWEVVLHVIIIVIVVIVIVVVVTFNIFITLEPSQELQKMSAI